jgi:hypothetical protein
LHPKAHVRIARKVALDLGRADLSSTLEHNSVIPDEWRDFPHHTGGRRQARIFQRVLRARNYYIYGNDNNAAAELGVSFHYIADEHVLVKGSDTRHTSYESKISKAPLNIQNIDSMEGKNATLGYIAAKMRELGDRQYLLTPEEALNSSYKTCASIAKSVLGSKTSPKLHSILIGLRKTSIEKMQEEEEKLVSKLIEIAKKDGDFKGSEGMKKITDKIIRTLSFFDFRFRRNIKRYKQRKHLEESVRIYYMKARWEYGHYKDWYAIETPELSIFTQEVKPKLLTVELVAKALNLDTEKLERLTKKAKIMTITLKDEEFFRREDVQRIAAHLKIPNPLEENFQNKVQEFWGFHSWKST